MSDSNAMQGKGIPMSPGHAHSNGRRCCGRLLSEKCTPEEEAAKTDPASGEKSCCKENHKH